MKIDYRYILLLVTIIGIASKSVQYVVVVVVVVVINKRQSNCSHVFNINLDTIASSILLMQHNRQLVLV